MTDLVGQDAPDFTLRDQDGKKVTLSELRGQTVVLVFYPLDWSPVCTDQLNLYQDAIGDFKKQGATLYGVSVDSAFSHKAFQDHLGIDFPLLADFEPKGEVARKYDMYMDKRGHERTRLRRDRPGREGQALAQVALPARDSRGEPDPGRADRLVQGAKAQITWANRPMRTRGWPAHAERTPWPVRSASALPSGRTLPDKDWRRRHRAMLTCCWLHAAGLTLFALAQGFGVSTASGRAGSSRPSPWPPASPASASGAAATLVSVGLITSSAVLVHIWGGVIEAHFHFFVMIVLLSLYEDWLPFLVAAAYVVIHHGLTGALEPHPVYNHADAIAHPWKWAAIHGLFVAGAGIGSVVAWRLNEEVRAETERAYQRRRRARSGSRARSRARRSGWRSRPRPAECGRYLQVNPAMLS